MTVDVAAHIESQVRDQIRDRGVDPLREFAVVRGLIDEALEAWEQRALIGAVLPLMDREATAKSVIDNVAGLGPLQRYLDDPDVEEIWINEPG
jgi:pilus assembly protein CpaF